VVARDTDSQLSMTNRTPGPVPLPSKHQLSLMIWLCVFPTLTLIALAGACRLASCHPDAPVALDVRQNFWTVVPKGTLPGLPIVTLPKYETAGLMKALRARGGRKFRERSTAVSPTLTVGKSTCRFLAESG
jgi:hypothetical protein